MSDKYLVNYCLDKESDFEDFHSKYNEDTKELVLPINEIELLLDKCVDDLDNVDISFGGELSGKWDVLEVHGIDGEFYNLQYMLSGSLYLLNRVSKEYLMEHLAKVERTANELISLGFEGKSV